MILYKRGGIYHLLNIFQRNGSVFPQAFWVAAPAGMIAGILRYLIDANESFAFLRRDDSILSDSQVFGSFGVFMAFLIVFRTSQAHTRFWEGATATHRMRAEWFDAASAIVAFCHHSTVPVAQINHFKQILVRLFSMLHSTALTELDINSHHQEATAKRGFHFDVLDPEALDELSLKAVLQSNHRVELVFEWIQALVVSEIKSGVLTIPAPILSRAFQEIANGMVAFHEAQKIVTVPFPFPYSQICDCLLMIHWILVPFVTSQWVRSYVWCTIFVFVQVFVLWALNFIAVEIEDPFGEDANDLDARATQDDFNHHLLLLMKPDCGRIPTLIIERDAGEVVMKTASLSNVWVNIIRKDSTKTTSAKAKPVIVQDVASCETQVSIHSERQVDTDVGHPECRDAFLCRAGTFDSCLVIDSAVAHDFSRETSPSRSERSAHTGERVADRYHEAGSETSLAKERLNCALRNANFGQGLTHCIPTHPVISDESVVDTRDVSMMKKFPL